MRPFTFAITVILGMLTATAAVCAEIAAPALPQTARLTLQYVAPPEAPLTCSKPGIPKNVIFMIGDGMGLNALCAAKTLAVAPGKKTHLERCDWTAFCTTHSANGPTTDSAAAATALLCGEKANRGALGQTPDGRPLTSLLVRAQEAGKRTGVITAEPITEATPAASYAHVPKRSDETTIARQLLQSGFDLFIGGGREVFQTLATPENKQNPGTFLQGVDANGYRPVADWTVLQRINPAEGKTLALLTEGGFNQSDPGKRLDLSAVTQLAIEKLSACSPRGFFLLVEGSEIDDAEHDKDANLLVNEMADFDMAAGKALAFAEQNRETLVIATADHETGGVGLGSEVGQGTVQVSFVGGHSPAMVPLMAAGVGAPEFHGFLDNTEVAKRVAALLKP